VRLEGWNHPLEKLACLDHIDKRFDLLPAALARVQHDRKNRLQEELGVGSMLLIPDALLHLVGLQQILRQAEQEKPLRPGLMLDEKIDEDAPECLRSSHVA
jgi:hypothetical protein